MSLNQTDIIETVAETFALDTKGAKGLLKLCKHDPNHLGRTLTRSGYEGEWVDQFLSKIMKSPFQHQTEAAESETYVVLGHKPGVSPTTVKAKSQLIELHQQEEVGGFGGTIELDAVPALLDLEQVGSEHRTQSHVLTANTSHAPAVQAPIEVDYSNPPPSDNFDDYDIEKTLGEGGMGQVLLGVERATGRRYAIKLLLASMADNSEAYKRFEREVQTMKGLNHPAITSVYQQGHTDKGPFMVMEYVEGETLPGLLGAAGGRLSPQIAILILHSLLSALDHAHEKDVLHRDLKLSNMMVNKHGEFKLMDFGVAKLLGEQGLTKTGMVIGTVDFMSPEQALGRPLSPATDLFCVGLILFTMMSGRSYFRRSTPTDSMIAITREPSPRIFEELPFTPYILEYIVDTLTQKDPDERKYSAADVVNMLQPFVDALNERNPNLLKDFVHQSREVHETLCQATATYYDGCAQHFESQNHPACAALYAYKACLIQPQNQTVAQTFNTLTTSHQFNFGKPIDERISTLEKLVFDDPDDIQSLTTLTNACAGEGNWHRYASYMRRLIKMVPEQADTYQNTLRTVDPEYLLLTHVGWLGPK